VSGGRRLAFAIAFVGLGLIGLSMPLPVKDAGSTSFASISENTLIQFRAGQIALALTAVAAFSVIRALRRPPKRLYAPFVCGLLVIGVAVVPLAHRSALKTCPSSLEPPYVACLTPKPGIGIYVLGLGGAALLTSGALFLRSSKAG
jgi:hypothetical protein